MPFPRKTLFVPVLLTALLIGAGVETSAATLTGSFASIPRNSVVNLSSNGPVDWVHWGLFTETSINRKAGVTPRIGDFKTISNFNSNAFVYAYQFSDNYNGYSWSDGTPVIAVTNTTTGVWAYGIPSAGTGFELTVPADTTMRSLKVFVGAFAAHGLFQASLSDGSASGYSNSSLDNMMNGPSGTYTITFAAASSGQTLQVRWTVLQAFRPDGNVTLQAAALSSPGVDNPPAVTLTSPTDNAQFTAPTNITLAANASDFDGNVTRVEFYANNQKVGEDTTDPYSAQWNNVAPGIYTLKALAYDNGGEVSESMPVEIFVNGTGGSLVGSIASPPSTVNLTMEGTADWTHWGLETNSLFDRKVTSTPQLGDFTQIGENPVQRYADNFTGYSWTDGTPRASATNSHTGVFIIGQNQGFALTLPADTTPRTVKVYAGLYGAQGNFQAWLSDFSAPAYTDNSLTGVFESDYGVYTLTFTAASIGKTLNIRYQARQLYDSDFGNVTLQAVTLVGGGAISNAPPAVTMANPTNNAHFTAPANITLSATASDDNGVAKVDFFNGTTWLGQGTGNSNSFAWDNVPPDTYSVTARATDNYGLTATSAPVTITVLTAPASVTLLNPSWVGSDFAFSFASQSGHTYDVQYTGALGTGDWHWLETLTGDGSTLLVTNKSASSTQRFYRVQTK